MKKLTLPLTCALALLLTACGAGPGAQASRFYQEAGAGHASEAMEVLDPELKQVMGSKIVAAIERSSKQTSAKGGLKSVNVIEEKVDGDRATVVLEESFGNGTTAKESAKMRKVDGKWYVTI